MCHMRKFTVDFKYKCRKNVDYSLTPNFDETLNCLNIETGLFPDKSLNGEIFFKLCFFYFFPACFLSFKYYQHEKPSSEKSFSRFFVVSELNN